MFNFSRVNFKIPQVTEALNNFNNFEIPSFPDISLPEIPEIPEITPQNILEKAGIPVTVESLEAQAKVMAGATQDDLKEYLMNAGVAKNATDALEKVKQMKSSFETAQQDIAGAVSNAQNIAAGFGDGLANLGGGLGGGLANLGGGLGGGLANLGGGLGGGLANLGGGLGGGLSNLGGGLSGGGSSYNSSATGKSMTALSYPSDTGSDNVKDYIVFIAYSSDVAGYTKFSTTDSSSVGEPEGTVQLYIPENLAVQSQVGYQNTTQGSIVSGIANLKDDGEFSLKGAGAFITDIAGVTLSQLGDSGGVAAQASGGFAGVGAANRHVLFEGVDFRTFSYAYEFLPKSWEESVKIKEIIKFFRINMLPEIRDNGITFDPPNWFSIEYMIDGKPTNYLNKIKPSVCTGCDVSYGGNGQFAMFQSDRGEDPAPALINLTLTFQEVQVVSKVDAQGGY